MNAGNKRIGKWKKWAMITTMGTAFAFPFGSCEFGEFQATSTVTLDGRDVVTYLVSSWILTPISNAIDAGVNQLFDKFENNDDA